MILALLVVLLVGSFTMNSTELSVSRSHFNDYRATLAMDSAFEAATRKVFHQLEKTDDFVVFRRQQQGSSASHLRPVVYYTAVYDVAAKQWKYQPLISGARTDLSTATLTRQPGGATLKDATMVAGGTEVKGFNLVPGTGASGWADLPLNPAWEYLDFRPKDTTGVPATPPNLSANPQDIRTKGQDLRVRYCFWAEDLAGKLDGSLAGNTEGPNLTHFRGQPALNGDQPRQASLFTLLPPAPATPGTVFPNLDTAVSSTVDNLVINQRQYLLTNETLAQIGLGANQESMLRKAVNFGTPTWFEREVIPHKTHIAPTKRGLPKLAINKLIERAESDTSPDGSGERHAAITELAEHIKAAYPNFASKRVGGNVGDSSLNVSYQGIPYGTLLSADEYIYSLAANIIDYADRDQTPSVDPAWVPSTSTNSYGPGDTSVPKYRGIDLQPYCVGYATRFLNSDWTSNSVTAQISVWVALWNPTDREIEGDISVRFTENRTVLNTIIYTGAINTTTDYGSRPVLPHLNLPPKRVSLGPNEFIHVPWYDIHQLTATGIPAATLTDNRFHLCPDDKYFKSLFDGGYQIFWNGKLADRTRRPDNINRPHRQPTQLKGKARLGGWFYACSGIGESNFMGLDPRGTLYTPGLFPYNAPSATDDPGNRGLYYREAFYSNNYFWGGGVSRTSFSDTDRFDPNLWSSDPGHASDLGQWNKEPFESETPDIHLKNRKVPNPPRPEKAPAHVKHPVDDYPAGYSGPGYYESIGELGLVFDPSAWSRTSGGGSPNRQGGGRTLRIGSPELTTFTTAGTSAIDLLDILCADEKRPMKGLVNVNSLRPEVARTLFAGMELRSERAITGGTETTSDGMIRNAGASGPIYPPCGDASTNAGGVFSAALTMPTSVVLTSPFDLANLKTVTATGSPTGPLYFGDLAAWPSTSTTQYPTPQSPRPVASGSEPGLDDRGREEMFRRILPLITFHSRIFRMHMTTQVLDQNDKVIVTRSKAYDVLLEPTYDSAGKIIGQKVKVTYEKNL